MQKFALTWYIQVILYDDELADSGISFLTVKVVSVSQWSLWAGLCNIEV
jgi:hypothetical protein